MANEVVVYDFDQKRLMAKYFADSGLFGAKSPEEAFALMMIAEAEGVHPAKALQEYHIIDGRPALKAEAMLARYQKAGGKIKWVERTNERCEAVFEHPAATPLVIVWDIARAEAADLMRKKNWQRYPAQMLAARVIAEGVRGSYPACILGHVAAEEIDGGQLKTEPVPKDGPSSEPVEAEVVEAEHVSVLARLRAELEETPDEGLDAWIKRKTPAITMMAAKDRGELQAQIRERRAGARAAEAAEVRGAADVFNGMVQAAQALEGAGTVDGVDSVINMAMACSWAAEESARDLLRAAAKRRVEELRREEAADAETNEEDNGEDHERSDDQQ